MLKRHRNQETFAISNSTVQFNHYNQRIVIKVRNVILLTLCSYEISRMFLLYFSWCNVLFHEKVFVIVTPKHFADITCGIGICSSFQNRIILSILLTYLARHNNHSFGFINIKHNIILFGPRTN